MRATMNRLPQHERIRRLSAPLALDEIKSALRRVPPEVANRPLDRLELALCACLLEKKIAPYNLLYERQPVRSY